MSIDRNRRYANKAGLTPLAPFEPDPALKAWADARYIDLTLVEANEIDTGDDFNWTGRQEFSGALELVAPDLTSAGSGFNFRDAFGSVVFSIPESGDLDASTTKKGFVELATRSEIQNGATGKAATSENAQLLNDVYQWIDFIKWKNATASTGASTLLDNDLGFLYFNQGASASPTTYKIYTTLVRTPWDNLNTDGSTSLWQKAGRLDFLMNAMNLNPSSFIRILMGPSFSSSTVKSLDIEGLGFEIANTAIHGVAHDGASLNTVDLSTNLPGGNNALHFSIQWDGAGNVEWFLNGVSVGTSSAGPTSGSGQASNLHIEIDQGSGNSNIRMSFSSLRLKSYNT